MFRLMNEKTCFEEENAKAHTIRSKLSRLQKEEVDFIHTRRTNLENDLKCNSLENGQMETEVDTLCLQISKETIRHVHSEQTRFSLQEKLEYLKKVWELVWSQ